MKICLHNFMSLENTTKAVRTGRGMVQAFIHVFPVLWIKKLEKNINKSLNFCLVGQQSWEYAVIISGFFFFLRQGILVFSSQTVNLYSICTYSNVEVLCSSEHF